MLSAKVKSDGNLTTGDSGETSLAQKFKETGVNLDNYFKNGEYERIKTEWLQIYKNKLEAVIKKQNQGN